MLAGVLWYNKQLSDSYEHGFKAAEAILSIRHHAQKEQSRTVTQEQSKELVEEQGKQKETIRIITKEVVKYVENLPKPTEVHPVPTCRNVSVDDEFVRLWNDAATNTAHVDPRVSGEPAKEVSK